MNLNRSLVALAVMLSASVPAQSAVVFTLQEVGSDVVLSGSGTLNLTGLSYSSGVTSGVVWASVGAWVTGDGSATALIDTYAVTPTSGPTAFGSGGITVATSASGDAFGQYLSAGRLFVPLGYVSGSLLSGTATFAGQTLASMGATLGTYTWTWGNGPSEDSITLKVGNVSAVPEPSAYALALAGLGVLGVWGRRQKAQKRMAEAAAA